MRSCSPATNDEGAFDVHLLPESDVRPVYVTDKQRAGNVKAFK